MRILLPCRKVAEIQQPTAASEVRENCGRGQHGLSEDPDTAHTGNGAESDGETSKGGGANWSSQDSKAQRAQSATS